MRPIEVWFRDWLQVHLKLHRHADLPDPASVEGKVEFRVWARRFREAGVTETEAADASERLYVLAVHEAKHFFTLMSLIEAARSGRDLGITEDPEVAARRESRTCPECEGNGLAVRYRQRSSGPPVLLYCTCPLGRHLHRTGRGPGECLDLVAHPLFRGQSGEGYRRPPALRLRHRPTEPAGTSPFSAWWRTGKPEPNAE